MTANRTNTGNLTRYEFRPCDLCKKAFQTYSNSDSVWYVDGEGNLYEAENGMATTAWLIGSSIDDAEEYLLWAAEEEEETR